MTPFDELMGRVRTGCPVAFEQLIRQYEPELRRLIRVRLRGNVQLTRELESMDICQSVMFRFHVGLKNGEFDLNDETAVKKLLARMAINKLIDQLRRRRLNTVSGTGQAHELEQYYGIDQLADQSPSPSVLMSQRESLEKVLEQLSPDERHVVESREAGRTWEEIAAQMGRNPDAVRKQFNRTQRRLNREEACEEAE